MQPVFRAIQVLVVFLMQAAMKSIDKEDGEKSWPTDQELQTAILSGNSQLVRQAIAMGLDTERAMKFYNHFFAPIHLTSISGQAEIAQLLISAQADVNLQQSTGCSALYIAAQCGCLQVVEVLISAQADVNLPDSEDCTPLYLASQNGHVSVVRSLIKAQADVNSQVDSGASSLYIASQRGHGDVVDLLIQANADVNLEKDTGSTPLDIASQQGHLHIVEQLVQAGANVNTQRKDGVTPVYIAAQKGHHRVVNFLINANADVDTTMNESASPLYVASQNDHVEVMELLLAKSTATINVKTNFSTSPLFIASQKGHYRAACLLISAKADVNIQTDKGYTPLHISVQKGHQEIVNLLIKSRAAVDMRDAAGRTALSYSASSNGQQKSADALIKAQADVNLKAADGASPLVLASQDGHLEVLELLIEAQADVDQQTWNGCTPLYIASQNGHCSIVSALIKSGAEVGLPSFNGATPLAIASQNGDLKITDLLIKANADVNAQAKSGESPLFLASQNGHHEVVKYLLKAGANLNLLSFSSSPLYTASQNGHCRVVELLISAKADVNIQTDSGSTPLYISAQNGQHQIVDLLIRAGADIDHQESQGCTALYIASQKGHRLIVDTLLTAQADVNLQSAAGATPVFMASQNDHHGVVLSLIKAQADVDIQESNGCTPLYIASQNGHRKVVESLITAEAAVNIQAKSGASALTVAAQNGHDEIVRRLISARADVNHQDEEGSTPLFLASQNGHDRVVESLIVANADMSLCRRDGESPLFIATRNGYHRVVAILNARAALQSGEIDKIATQEPGLSVQDTFSLGPVPSDAELSLQLHSALSKSGFTDTRAALQASVADALQLILRRRVPYDGIFVLGSYSEGWGNSLVRVDGVTDVESDIDMMQVIQGRLYHPKDWCKCSEPVTRVECADGHLLCAGFASNPAKPLRGSFLRPAVDFVETCNLCCYPPIAPLLSERIKVSNLPQAVLSSLQNELSSSACHVVHAAPSGEAGKQLRVSTTFLERRLLRSLGTLQGQLFIILKYLVKKVINHKEGYNVQGLKAYHAKTITFRMVEETPAKDWKPENLLDLTRRSLEMLLGFVRENCTKSNKNAKVMEHFFLCDAALYLKGVGPETAQDVSQALQSVISALTSVISQLPQILMKFTSTLRPLNDSGSFYFHPFLILPDIRESRVPDSGTQLNYHEIYTAVRESLLRLSGSGCSLELQESLLTMIPRLPDCAFSARVSLRVLTHLKFGQREAAVDVLNCCRGHEVSRAIVWSNDAAKPTEEFVWRHLKSCDSAWKFCFEFEQRLTLHFLPRVLRENFLLDMDNYKTYFYVNFDALLQGLRLELTPDDAAARAWLQETARREDSDVYELTIALEFCDDAELQRQLKEKLSRYGQSRSLKQSFRRKLVEQV